MQRILIISKAVFDDEAEYECDARTSKSSGMLTVVGEFSFNFISIHKKFIHNIHNVYLLFCLQRKRLDSQRTWLMLKALKLRVLN